MNKVYLLNSLSYICLECNLNLKCLNYYSYSILPDTTLYYTWKTLTLILVIVFSMTLSLQATFLYANVALWVVNYALDCYFILDM